MTLRVTYLHGLPSHHTLAILATSKCAVASRRTDLPNMRRRLHHLATRHAGGVEHGLRSREVMVLPQSERGVHELGAQDVIPLVSVDDQRFRACLPSTTVLGARWGKSM